MEDPVYPENEELQEFYRLLGSTATASILKGIHKGENQYKYFY